MLLLAVRPKAAAKWMPPIATTECEKIMANASPEQGKFVTGSTMRHVIGMTVTSSVGLVSIFIVDALNLFYISRLGQKELAAAVGYAGTLLFFFVSLGIGLSIAASALCSRALGRGDRKQANEISGASLFLSGMAMLALTVAVLPWLNMLVHGLGATGETARLAVRFIYFVLPSMPLLGLGMCCSGLLRAVGDAKRAMYVTLGAGAATAVLDPILIFGFGLGLDGAAIANVLARIVLIMVGFYGLVRVHHLYARPDKAIILGILKPFFAIGLPAILTQVATPVGNAFVTVSIAKYGDAAVAGWAVIGRLIPVSFGVIFALSGAVGPILGQNYGAARHDRMHSTMRDSLVVTVVYVVAVWALLALFRNQIADAFDAQAQGRELIVFFCLFVAGSFIFNGTLFVANAAFNNLGFPLYSTVLNWGRSTLGVIPFVWYGGQWYGMLGVLAGYGLGVVLFGVAGGVLCFRVLARIKREGVTH
jgi:putative MATE family efflux protein